MNRSSVFMTVAGSVVLAALVMPGQDGDRQWKIGRRDGDQVHFTIERRKPGWHMSTSNDVPLERFRGLPRDPGGPVKFEYVMDAGKLVCEGRFTLGRGAGKYTWTPDPNFVAELQKLGYDAPNDDQLFNMLVSDFRLDFARAVKGAGLRASTSELIDMRSHGLNADYIRETRAAGYRDFTARDYIDLRNHGVNTKYLGELQDSGYDLSAHEVVELRNHGVPSELLREAKELGHNFTTAEFVELRNNGVDSRYLRRLRESGMRDLTAGQIRKLRNHGVD